MINERNPLKYPFLINRPFTASDHMVQKAPCLRANDAIGDMVNKENLNLVALFSMPHRVICSLAWRFSYHLITSCKGSISLLINTSLNFCQ